MEDPHEYEDVSQVLEKLPSIPSEVATCPTHGPTPEEFSTILESTAEEISTSPCPAYVTTMDMTHQEAAYDVVQEPVQSPESIES